MLFHLNWLSLHPYSCYWIPLMKLIIFLKLIFSILKKKLWFQSLMHVIADGTKYWWVLYLKYKLICIETQEVKIFTIGLTYHFGEKKSSFWRIFFKCILCHKFFSLKQENSHIYKFTIWKDFLILFFYLSYFEHHQIWLNILTDDRQLNKKTVVQM